MNPYIWSGLYSFIANSAIGLFVYTRNPAEKKNQLFCLFSFSVALWSVGSFLVNIISDKSIAIWVLRFNYLFGAWTPVFYVHLVYSLVNAHTAAQKNKLKIFYACSVFLSPFVFTHAFIPSLKLIENHSFYITQPGFLYYIFFGYFAVAMAEIIFQSFRGLATKGGREFHQLKFLAIANFFAIAAGFEYFLRVFGIFQSPPLDDYLLIGYTVLLAYGVTRYQLFDVDALVRAFRKERLATLGLLTSCINHEIKNPLYIIKGLLEKHLEPGQPWSLSKEEDVKGLLQKIYAQANRISELMGRYQGFLKGNESKKLEEGSSASIDSCLDHALQVIALLDKGKQVSLHKEIEKNIPNVCITPGELEEVLMNLIMNAFQAVNGKGRILISAKTNGKKVKIRIEDNGIGIAPFQLKKLFRPFSSTKGDKGVGLGLYLTKEIVARNGGKISVQSISSKGTTFEIELIVETRRR